MASEAKGVKLTIAPNASYLAEDLLFQRKFKGLHDECLVKWVLQEPPGKLKEEEEKELERVGREYCIWMRKDEVEACCPHLLPFKIDPEAVSAASSKLETQSAREDSVPVMSDKDEVASAMKKEVQNIILRAKKLMSGGDTAVLVTTVGLLNVYSKIEGLTRAFQEYGAIEVLLGLLGSRDADLRRESSNLLHSLMTSDLSIRGCVLLQLIKSDTGSKSSLQSRQMLLDLFSETVSSDESDDMRDITLPHVSACKCMM